MFAHMIKFSQNNPLVLTAKGRLLLLLLDICVLLDNSMC